MQPDNNDLISIIVPIYNAEKYLPRCIQSILNQTYKNIEVILVDDGSHDKCSEICDEFAKNDKRVKVIHKRNGGISSARNAGLDIAEGKYIGFVDNDDYIEPHMYEKLLKVLIKSNTDFAMCDYFNVDESGNILNLPGVQYNKNEVITFEKIQSKSGYNNYNILVWNKLFKSYMFEKVRFPDGKLSEDYFIAPKLYHERTSVCIKDKLYYFTFRQNSVSKTLSFKWFKDQHETCIYSIKFYADHGYSNIYMGHRLRLLLWSLGQYTRVCPYSKSSKGKLYYKKKLALARKMLFQYGLKDLPLSFKAELILGAVSPKISYDIWQLIGKLGIKI